MKWPEAEAQLRSRLGTAQYGEKADLAAALGMTPTHLSQLISGKRPITREVAERIAQHYRIEIDYVLQEKP
jgi:transcriptional regulator with XRE-family HTH domain